MKESKRAVLNTAIEVVGGIVGGGLGAFVGPEAAAAGTAVGTVGAVSLARFGSDCLKIPARYFERGKVLEVLKEKVEAEMDSSFLGSQRSFELAMIYMRDSLAVASTNESSVGNLESRLPRYFRWKLASAQSAELSLTQNLKALGEYCRSNGPIRIGCPAICCAPIAIFRDLSERLGNSFGVQFSVSCDEPNGRSFFERLGTDSDLHFALGPLEAFILADPGRKIPLRVIGPIFGQRQRVFVNMKDRIHGRHPGVWIFDKSSAKFQFYVGQGMERNAKEEGFNDAGSVPDLVRSFPAGDFIVVWDPLSNLLKGREDFKVVHHSQYSVSFCLYGHTKVFVKKNHFPLDDFLTVFLTEWRRRQLNLGNLIKILSHDDQYMRAFALGCGMTRDRKP